VAELYAARDVRTTRSSSDRLTGPEPPDIRQLDDPVFDAASHPLVRRTPMKASPSQGEHGHETGLVESVQFSLQDRE
jgi:hypothetical protein